MIPQWLAEEMFTDNHQLLHSTMGHLVLTSQLTLQWT